MGYYRGFQYPLGDVKVNGTIEKIYWTNGEIATVKLDDVTVMYGGTGTKLSKGPITCVGISGFKFEAGKKCVCYGEIVRHNRYGNQVKVCSSFLDVNTVKASDIKTDDDLIDYIAEQKIDGINIDMACDIVNYFDSFDEARNVIMCYPNKLYDVKIKGLGPKRTDYLVSRLAKNADERRLFDARKGLTEHGITSAVMAKLIKKYDDVACAYDAVKNNPYVLANIKGVGFKTADGVAAQFGIVGDDPRRVKAAINYVINDYYCGNYGYTIVPQKAVINKTRDVLSLKNGERLDEQQIRQLIQSLIDDHKFATDRDDVNSVNRWLRPVEYFVQEQAIIKSVHSMLGEYDQSFVLINDLENLIDDQQAELMRIKHYRLSDNQLDAVCLPFTNCLSLFTGGAGTGKTSTIEMIAKIADELHIPYVLCAPTGKAAKRMRDTCLNEHSHGKAFTVHKMLGIYSSKGAIDEFKQASLVICDEASMLDTYLASELFSACSQSDKHLLLTGDVNQLPSIDPGAVFSDLLNYPGVATTCLGRSYRQSKGSSVLDAAAGVLNGLSPCRKELNIEFYECDGSNVTKTLEENVLPMIDREGLRLYGSGDIVAFLSPKNEGSGSVTCLNNYLRPKYNKNFIDMKDRNFLLQEGDFVVQTSNVYSGYDSDNGKFCSDHMNGDQAVIKEIGFKRKRKYYVVRFLDGGVEEVYSEAEAKEYLKLAYATTVHKYQGSQCHTAVIVMMNNFGPLLNKNLLYTALTRATDRVILVGSRWAFDMAAATNAKNRFTGIYESLHLC